jgi:hypothetical protein
MIEEGTKPKALAVMLGKLFFIKQNIKTLKTLRYLRN